MAFSEALRASPVPGARRRRASACRLPGPVKRPGEDAMNLTRVAVTVGLACVAANLLMKTRRGAASEGDDGLDPFPSVDPGLAERVRAITSATAVAATAGADTGAPGSGS